MALEEEGYAVRTYIDGSEVLHALNADQPDVAVLDIKMPRMDGLELLSHLRKKTNLPVILLTSKDDEVDKLTELRLGADDYIKKPFSQRLLIERIRTLIRRSDIQSGGGENTAGSDIFSRGALTLDPSRHFCSWKGDPVNLTVTEYLLIQTLARHPGHVKSRDQLIDVAYGEHIYVDDRTIDRGISRVCAESSTTMNPEARLHLFFIQGHHPYPTHIAMRFKNLYFAPARNFFKSK